MKIGVFVGSFNPVHIGHIKIANYVANKYVDKVIIVPTGNYWNKQNLIDINYRINMLKLYQDEKIIIDEENNNVQYTYKVLENINKKYVGAELYLIIGADNIVNFNKWKRYKQLLKYNMIIVNRDNVNIKYYLNKLNKKDKYIITQNLPEINISSTDIRENLNINTENIISKIDYNVLKYIKNNNLYIRKNIPV